MRTLPIWLVLGVCLWATGSIAQTAEEYTASIIPVAGSAAGAFGSWWSTSIQLFNPHAVAVSGRLVFRPVLGSVPPNEESVAYSLAPGATQTIGNLGAIFGRAGLGTLDVTATRTGGVAAAPIVLAHILSDQGSGATVGMTEEAVDPNMPDRCSTSTRDVLASRVLRPGVRGFLIAPASADQYRLNIGVRTLGSGATLIATLQNSVGEVRQKITKTYPANYFVQTSAWDFLGTPMTGGESITIVVVEGSAIVYGATINNFTNDASMQYVYGVLSEE